jgi:hypothetical protein
MWQALQIITDYKGKPSRELPSYASLPDELNAFYDRFEAINTEACMRDCKMAPVEMAAVLRVPNQLCYYVGGFALFVTYFVRNVSATVSYGKKELLDIRTTITHLGLDKELLDIRTVITHLRLDKYFFFNKQDAQDILQTPDRNNIPSFARESDAGIEDKEPDAWSGPDEGDWESWCYRQYY